MQIVEGVKVSQQLLNQAFSDPDYTLGFEAEFYVVGAQEFMRQQMTQGLEQRDTGGGNFYVKKLGDLNWHDVLQWVVPLGVDTMDMKDNHEILLDRLQDAFQEVTGDDPQSHSGEAMWDEMRQERRVHELLGMLRAFPEHRFLHPESEAVRDMFHDGDIEEIAPFGKLNDVEIATTEVGFEHDDHSVADNQVFRGAVYSHVAKQLSAALGEDVSYSVDEEKSFSVSQEHTRWVLVPDSSLKGEAHGDYVGMELISPVKQAKEGYQALMTVLKMMKSGIGGFEVVTSRDTGLHINLGTRGSELDTLKMLVLLGDDHILKQFGRLGNEFAGQSLGELIQRAKKVGQGSPVNVGGVAMSNEIVKATSSILRQIKIDQTDMQRLLGLLDNMKPAGKSYSVNFSKLPSGYVEIRSIGGAYDENLAGVQEAVFRMIVTVYIATDPNAYRQEFLKKLYKIIVDIVQQVQGQPQQLAASGGTTIGRGPRGGYGSTLDDLRDTPYDGEQFVQYGFDPGSNTQ